MFMVPTLDFMCSLFSYYPTAPPCSYHCHHHHHRSNHLCIGSLHRIWIEEGVRGLYRGLGATMLGYLPTWTVYFGTYDRFKWSISRISGRSGVGGS